MVNQLLTCRRDYFIAAGSVYGFSLFVAWARCYLYNGLSHRAHVEIETDTTVRVTVPTKLKWTAGQHVFARFLALGPQALTMHPFTICSLPATEGRENRMVFYIKPTKGITARLGSLAGSQKTVPVFLDGPYGGIHVGSFGHFDRVLLIAGGSGGGFLLPVLEDILRRKANKAGGAAVKATEVHVVWLVKNRGMSSFLPSEAESYILTYSRTHPMV